MLRGVGLGLDPGFHSPITLSHFLKELWQFVQRTITGYKFLRPNAAGLDVFQRPMKGGWGVMKTGEKFEAAVVEALGF